MKLNEAMMAELRGKPVAEALRRRFRELPKTTRDANQNFSIRIWRALSWLQRAEELEPSDTEGLFISAWIGFNALYGRQDDESRPWGDRESWGTFLAQIWRVDHDGRLRRVLCRRQHPVLRLIENKYLSAKFWRDPRPGERAVKKELKESLVRFGTPNMLPVLRVLFERLYLMRVQVFHGASTKGSALNLRTLQSSASILLDLLPEMIAVMLDHGLDEDWGEVCFAPR